MRTVQIRIVDGRRKTVDWLRQLISAVTLVAVPIGIGIAVDSAAMQWAGFILGFLLLFVYATANGRVQTVRSIEEARSVLDLLEHDELERRK